MSKKENGLKRNSLQYHLVEIFKAVADACDSDGAQVPDDIRKAYEKAMQFEPVLRFYGKLVDQRNGEYLDYALPTDGQERAVDYSDRVFDHGQVD